MLEGVSRMMLNRIQDFIKNKIYIAALFCTLSLTNNTQVMLLEANLPVFPQLLLALKGSNRSGRIAEYCCFPGSASPRAGTVSCSMDSHSFFFSCAQRFCCSTSNLLLFFFSSVTPSFPGDGLQNLASRVVLWRGKRRQSPSTKSSSHSGRQRFE